MDILFFHEKFPDFAEKETRSIVVKNESLGLPLGQYFLLESYCTDKKCDCKRVFINVLFGEKFLATIGYGWGSLEFYKKWFRFEKGDENIIENIKGPILELTGHYTQYSEKLLELFNGIMVKGNSSIFSSNLGC